MKKFSYVVYLFLIPLIVAVFVWWSTSTKAVSSDQSLESFVIPKGSSVAIIGKRLKEDNFIRSATTFKFFVQLTGKQKKVQAGEYKISGSWTLYKIVDQFIKGPSEVWVTIPEGFRKEEIAQRVVNSLGMKEESNLFYQEFLTLTEDSEGFLFPDTYLFPQEVAASVVVKKLSSTFDMKVDRKMRDQIEKSPYSFDDVITIASLVERETRTEAERPMVAGILYKRLEKDWLLQIDATVQYALANNRCTIQKECEWWQVPSKKALSINSFYNTYKYPALPPTPICNPGLSSINAAIYPEISPYWFYLHDLGGKIHFAETIEEHNQNISIYLD